MTSTVVWEVQVAELQTTVVAKDLAMIFGVSPSV